MSKYALAVRDNIVDRIKAMEFFADFKKISTNKAEQIQPENVPFVGVYFVDETNTPDGDANVGEVRFQQSALYGFSVIIQGNDAAAAEQKLGDIWDEISDGLFSDPTLYNAVDARIQGYSRGSHTHQFGSIGQDNSIPIAELRFDLMCNLGVVTYPPTVTDHFNKLHIKTQWPSGGTPEEIAAEQQVEAEYDITWEE